jgi:hypothetical protein
MRKKRAITVSLIFMIAVVVTIVFVPERADSEINYNSHITRSLEEIEAVEASNDVELASVSPGYYADAYKVASEDNFNRYMAEVERQRVAEVERQRVAGSQRAKVNTYRSQQPSSGTCVLPDYICRRESGGNPNAVNPTGCGGRGCYGKYQFDPRTWDAAASRAGRPDLVGNAAGASEADQDEVAAHLWNGGAGCSHWAAC